MALDVAGFKQGQRAVWSAGDYPDIARLIESAAELLVEKAGVQAGQDVLDVATGSGNVALVAARRGAKVTGLDITPELLEAARRRATEAGVDVEWVEGDAEELPFQDASFDRVLSAFGTMFAPRHEVAADELLRVCRPGGLVAVAAWTPDGLNGRMFRTVSSHMPAPPPELKPPALWGDEDHMRGLMERPGVTLEFHLARVVFEFPSVAEWMAYTRRCAPTWSSSTPRRTPPRTGPCAARRSTSSRSLGRARNIQAASPPPESHVLRACGAR